MLNKTAYLGCITIPTPKPLFEILYACRDCGKVQIAVAHNQDTAVFYRRLLTTIDTQCPDCELDERYRPAPQRRTDGDH